MNEYENKSNYCRKLGQWITFSYCCRENNNLPCRSIVDCWFEILPVREFLEKNYDGESIAYLSATPKPKLASIVELIERAKKRSSRSSS